MSVIDKSEIKEIIKNHKHFIKRDCDGWESMKANLFGADLRDAKLSGVDLRFANLCNADLHNADLLNANLHGADLSGANLRNADLFGTDLRDAKLSNANLNYANLRDANLRFANLHGADLSDVDLCSANLCSANLYDAYLNGADLHGAKLTGANLRDADLCDVTGQLIEYRKGKILTEDIIGYKKCKNDIIITFKIPRGAIVFSINGTKCRTNKAKVIAIDNANRAYSLYNNMSYYVGDEFTIYDFNCEYNVECAEGIHFFTTREEAMNYDM